MQHPVATKSQAFILGPVRVRLEVESAGPAESAPLGGFAIRQPLGGTRMADHPTSIRMATASRRCGFSGASNPSGGLPRPNYDIGMTSPDRPWIFRTYAGYESPTLTNARFKANLAKGQTGLSVAFDLPTQTGYDSDHLMARGEVGKVGVPIGHLGDIRTVFDGIPVNEMNTSMTINATAMWLLALYAAVADEQGADRAALAGTTQNDILKEYLSRGTYVFPPEPSLRLTADLIEWTVREVPLWNPINVCSYHLQETGADPVLEVAYTLANACAVLDSVRRRVTEEELPSVVGRISFFCNAGIRFVEEAAKMRAFVRLWDRLTRERYGVQEEKLRRFRYGVQVNSLGLTAVQPENNVYRILLEMLAGTLARG